MRFLFLTTRYALDRDDSYLTDELAGGLIESGHSVDVLSLDWDAEAGTPTQEQRGRHGEKVVTVAPGQITGFGGLLRKGSKFPLSSRLAVAALRTHFEMSDYDVVVAWSPAIAMRAPLKHAISHGIEQRVLFIWDFFPIAHREAGLLPGGAVYRIAKALEDSLYRQFTAFITLLPRNIDYLKSRYPTSPGSRFAATPVWVDSHVVPLKPRDEVRAGLGLPLDKPIAVFGGQITDGRGIEQMVEATRLSEEAGSNVQFLFIGDGRLSPLVRERASHSTNVHYVPKVPRSDYLSVVGACDVGMVATLRQFTSFAFPSKTIDYLRVGIPVVAAVEDGSEYIDILARFGVCLGVPAGDPVAFQHAVEKWATDDRLKADMKAKTARCVDEVLDLRHAVRTLLSVIDHPKTEGKA